MAYSPSRSNSSGVARVHERCLAIASQAIDQLLRQDRGEQTLCLAYYGRTDPKANILSNNTDEATSSLPKWVKGCVKSFDHCLP